MPTLEELRELKKRLEEELDKPPHKRDKRLSRFHPIKIRLDDVEQQIQRKEQAQEDEKRKRKRRRKLLLGAGYQQFLELEDIPMKESLESAGWLEELKENHEELFSFLFNKDIDYTKGSQKQRLIVLGALILRNRPEDEWKALLQKVLRPDDDDWELFPEFTND